MGFFSQDKHVKSCGKSGRLHNTKARLSRYTGTAAPSPNLASPLERLEPRALLSGTVTLPLVNPGFDILYQPGSTTVTATLGSGQATEGFGVNRPVESLVTTNTVNVAYSDGTQGRNVDVPGWTMLPRQGPDPRPVASVINNPKGYQGKADNFASILFPPNGGSSVLIEQTLTGTSLQPETTYALSAQLADGGILNLQVGGRTLSATRSSVRRSGSSVFSSVTKTYVTHSKVPAGDLTVVLSNGVSTFVGSFDNVAFTATPRGSAPTPTPTPTTPGEFGVVNGRKQKATLTEADGTQVTFSLSGGTGTATQVGDQVQLQVTSQTPGAALAVSTKGGSRRVSLGNVTVTGSLKSFKAPAADLAGNLSVSGSVASLTLGNVTGNVAAAASVGKLTAGFVSGTLYSGGTLQSANLGAVTGTVVAAGAIQSISALSLGGATILSGANLGSDGLVGGADTAADTYAPGSIGAISVKGAVIGNSVVGAGVNPVDPVFGNGNDAAAAGTASLIKSISVRGNADLTSRFEAAAFGKIKILNKKVPDLAADPRFVVLH